MAVKAEIYSPQEFQFAYKAETSYGTKLNTTMSLMNVDDLVSVQRDVTQTLEPRSGSSGRVLSASDINTTDKGGHRSTISMSVILDNALMIVLLEQIVGKAKATIGNITEAITLDYNYTPAEILDNEVMSTNLGGFTLCMISPIANESIYFTGCVLEQIVIKAERTADGGRFHADLTWATEYRPADAAAAPTTPTLYGASFHYLRELLLRTVDAEDLVVNKLELTITNPGIWAGYQGSNGDPEAMTRAIPRVEPSLLLGVKYDTYTAPYWQTFRANSIMSIELGAKAGTWDHADNTFGFKAAFAKLKGNPQPAGTDQGVFQDIEFELGASTAGVILTAAVG
jgi:hypothetical protein